MNQWQCPVCKSRKVAVVGEILTCFKCGNQEYLYDYRNAHDDPMPTLPEPQSDLEDRVENLEAISAQRGSIPRRYYDGFQQIRGEVANLSNKVAKLYQKPQPEKPKEEEKPRPSKRKLGVTID